MRDGDSTEGMEVSERFRVLLSEWLTTPIPFDGQSAEAVSALGEPSAVEATWGHEIRTSYEQALNAAQKLAASENPARTEIRTIIRDLRAQDKTFRIFCHRRARPYYQSLSLTPEDPLLDSRAFLHSAAEYREADPFDVLLKLGPLRSRGWGSVPDAILTAPRFDTLVQVVWSGCNDEDGFGYDPIFAAATLKTDSDDRTGTTQSASSRMSWQWNIIKSGNNDTGSSEWLEDGDEFELFKDLVRVGDLRRATLIQIEEHYGILYPSHSQVLSLDLNASHQRLGRRHVGEGMAEGMFLIWPVLGDVQLGGLRVGEGNYSRIWKQSLREEMAKDTYGFVERLRRAGINLINLRACVVLWGKPPSTVIHAPQKRAHFETLIDVLGIDFDDSSPRPAQRFPWSRYAWAEIAHTRGEAIQTGLQEHEIADDEVLRILTAMLPQIRLEDGSDHSFSIDLPAGESLSGKIHFHRVLSIEDGFLAPESAIRIVADLNAIEQWRV